MKYLAISLFLLSSCMIREEDEYNYLTPQGYKVKCPGSFAHGITVTQVLDWVDIRVNDWIMDRGPLYGFDYCTAVSYNTIYELIDHMYIVTPWSPTGLAAGMHAGDGDEHHIWACLYTHLSSYDYPMNPPYPEWVIYNSGLWKWAVFPSDGIGFPVIGHELDHAIDIDHNTVVNGNSVATPL